MRMKKPYIATLDQVKISRQGEYGITDGAGMREHSGRDT